MIKLILCFAFLLIGNPLYAQTFTIQSHGVVNEIRFELVDGVPMYATLKLRLAPGGGQAIRFMTDERND